MLGLINLCKFKNKLKDFYIHNMKLYFLSRLSMRKFMKETVICREIKLSLAFIHKKNIISLCTTKDILKTDDTGNKERLVN